MHKTEGDKEIYNKKQIRLVVLLTLWLHDQLIFCTSDLNDFSSRPACIAITSCPMKHYGEWDLSAIYFRASPLNMTKFGSSPLFLMLWQRPQPEPELANLIYYLFVYFI